MVASHQIIGFSSPYEALDIECFQDCVCEYSRLCIETVLERCAVTISNDSLGFREFLVGCTNCISLSESWTPFMAICLQFLRMQDISAAIHGVANFALNTAFLGRPAEWNLTFPTAPATLCWGDWMISNCRNLFVKSSQNTCQVTFRGSTDGNVQLSRLDHPKWEQPCDVHLTPLQNFTSVGPLRFFPSTLSRHALAVEGDNLNETIDETTTLTIRSAIALLRDITPVYYEWITRVLRYISIVESPQDGVRSGSVAGAWGAIFISRTGNSLQVAESLVHEASHQYYNVLSLMSALVDSSDRRLYYSPVKQDMRPLERILTAYHAVVNIVGFYREYLARQPHDQHAHQLLKTMSQQMAQLQDTLRTADSLTTFGKTFLDSTLSIHRELEPVILPA